MKKKISALMLLTVLCTILVSCISQSRNSNVKQPKAKQSFVRFENISVFTPYEDIRFKSFNDDINLSYEDIRTLTFNRLTVWNVENTKKAEEILTTYTNPGLGVRDLHKKGITGQGVVTAIIDQNLAGEHPEFKGKLKGYYDLGCDMSPDEGSMHGPAVASLLVGNNIGTAPGSSVYYFAVPSWKRDSKYYADALTMIIEMNSKMEKDSDKIRVVSVSAAPSGDGSPCEKNNELWDEAVKKAMDANILVLDCTSNKFGFVSPGYYDPDAPEDLELFKSGWPNREVRETPENYVCAPCSYRTKAEEYVKNEFSYQYSGVGGLSWGIPYAAGVCALGWQVNPDLTAQEMKELLLKSAYTTSAKVRVINPAGLINMIESAN
jgi:subtilisin family serine protease